MELLMKRKQMMTSSTGHINQLLQTNTSRTLDTAAFVEYVFTLVAEFAKLEVTKMIN
jgi:hypothetical protein